jgi:hypothetical protein
MLRKNLEEHLDACFEDHYSLVVQALVGLQTALTDREAKLMAEVEVLSNDAGHLTAVNSDSFVWRIEDWSDVYARAKTGKSVSIGGPCVMTGTLGMGYRIAPTIFPFGEGIGKCKSMYCRLPTGPPCRA